MALFPVSSYGVGWNPTTRQGRAFIQVANGPLTPVPIANAEELTILLLLMSKTGVQFEPQTGELDIQPRPIGT